MKVKIIEGNNPRELELNRIQKIADSCLSPLSYPETGIVLDMIWRARHS